MCEEDVRDKIPDLGSLINRQIKVMWFKVFEHEVLKRTAIKLVPGLDVIINDLLSVFKS